MALLTLKRKLKSELRLKTADSKWEFHRDGPRLKVSMGVDRDNLTRTSWNTFQSHQKERTELERPEYCPSVFVNPDTGAVRMAYREMVIRFESQTSARRQHQILRKYGLKIREGKPKVANQLTVYDPQRKIFGYGLIQTANACAAEDEVLFATPNFLSEFRRDSTPSRMPIAADLWHLDMIQVRQAWNHTQGRDRNARSVIVAVLDDGVETGHPNLSPNIVAGGRDFFLNEGEPGHLDPGPKSFRAPFFSSNGNDIHGTACAGIVAAAGGLNGDAIGIAPQAQILPIKIFSGSLLAEDEKVANAIRYAVSKADVLSCSWEYQESDDIEYAVQDGAVNGRGGRGCLLFFAVGNDQGDIVFPASCNGAIAIGASTHCNSAADYTNSGPQLLLVAPSTGCHGKGIFTTDVSFPDRGYNASNPLMGGSNGQHFSLFGGTSASTPMAAGVGALMLAARNDLSRDTVCGVFEQSSDKITGSNPTGRNDRLGFGRLNAARAVDATLKLP